MRVVFRKFKKSTGNDDVIALFPGTFDGQYIMSYMHNGQHAPTVPTPGDTVPADWNDYKDLYVELVGQGYEDLVIVKSLHLSNKDL